METQKKKSLSWKDVYQCVSTQFPSTHTAFLDTIKTLHTTITDTTDFIDVMKLYNYDFVSTLSQTCKVPEFEIEEFFLDICNMKEVYHTYKHIPAFSWIWYDEEEFGTPPSDTEQQHHQQTSIPTISYVPWVTCCASVFNTCLLLYMIYKHRDTRKFL